MSTLEIRNEILEIVKNEEESSLQNLYQIIKNYKNQKQLDKMIEEGEEDIKAGRTYTIEEARKMILQLNSFTPKIVELTSRAIKDLNKIKSFNKALFGEEKAEFIIDKIFSHLKILESPNIDLKKVGGIDESFLKLKRTYRNLFLDYYKITYREGKTKIYIVRVFDTRQNPNKNKQLF